MSCPQCKGNDFLLFYSGGVEWEAFCATDSCIQADCKITINIKKDREPKRTSNTFNIGLGYSNATLARWKAPPEDHEAIMMWIKDISKPMCVFLGTTGIGKTYLSAALANYFKENNKDIYYITHRSFINTIQEGFSDTQTNHYIIHKFADKDLLILDDLGSATCTDWQIEQLLELIDKRYSNRLKTLITSNLKREEIKEKLEPRIYSRLFDTRNILIQNWSYDNRLNPNFVKE